jgi:hypothetical protein
MRKLFTIIVGCIVYASTVYQCDEYKQKSAFKHEVMHLQDSLIVLYSQALTELSIYNPDAWEYTIGYMQKDSDNSVTLNYLGAKLDSLYATQR